MEQKNRASYGLQTHAIEVPSMRGDHVHLYSAVLNDNLILFDTGPDTEQARSYLADNIEDFLSDPACLATALEQIGLYDRLKSQFEEFL
jgi:hypothetical protein